MKKNTIIILIIVITLIPGFLLFTRNSNISKQPTYSDADIKSVNIGGQNVKVGLALTPEQQTQGLSGRQSLADNTGVLFVFAVPGKYPFWMKDMNFPIDMIWFTPARSGEAASELRVVYIKKNALPKLYPETYGPSTDAKYVLEVPSGFSEKNNLKVGDTVRFTY